MVRQRKGKIMIDSFKKGNDYPGKTYQDDIENFLNGGLKLASVQSFVSIC
jgi:hypothetical protein